VSHYSVKPRPSAYGHVLEAPQRYLGEGDVNSVAGAAN
jgi:hypothetical protein